MMTQPLEIPHASAQSYRVVDLSRARRPPAARATLAIQQHPSATLVVLLGLAVTNLALALYNSHLVVLHWW
jgi:hypothetical protein